LEETITSVYAVAIEANAQEQPKIKISPAGEFKGFDGRVFTLNESTIVRTKEAGVDLPINVEHGYTTEYSGAAVGWIEAGSLELRDDGVYAKVTLNTKGKSLVGEQVYRYLSPEFVVNQKREVISIEGVALTNKPNLKLEINKTDNTKEQPMEEKEYQARIDALTEESNAKDETIADLTAKLKEQAFNAALAAGKVTPAQEEFAMSLELNQLESWLATQPVAPHTRQIDTEENTRDAEDLNDFAAQINW